MADLVTGVESAVLLEGVKFLYQQAGEILRGWRERQRDPDAPGPRVNEPPAGVDVPHADPIPEPAGSEMRDALRESRDLVKPIVDGQVDLDATPAQEAVANLRRLLETIMRSPITFTGEPSRMEVADINVVVKQVRGRAAGVRADLAKLPSRTAIQRVHVQTDGVDGEVIGVDLT